MKYTPPSDPHLVALSFRREQLSSARELKGYTKAHLANLIDKTPSAITQFESGVIQPDAQTIASLSLALGMPPQFFSYKPFSNRIPLEECHFRSLRSASQQVRRQSIKTGELILEIICFLENEGVTFPQERITAIKNELDFSMDIESLALKVRNLCGLGSGPILEPIKFLESIGVIILPLPNSCQEVDAFSTWVNGRPVIMLAMHKTSSRTHFDVAHELAHLLLHDDVIAGDPACEKEADSFAAAFLLPNISFLKECPRKWNLYNFLAVKKRWHVSVRACLYTAHKNGYLSPTSYKRANIEMNKRYGRSEPEEWDLCKPSLLKKSIELANQEGISLRDIAEAIALHENDLARLIKPIMNDS